MAQLVTMGTCDWGHLVPLLADAGVQAGELLLQLLHGLLLLPQPHHLCLPLTLQQRPLHLCLDRQSNVRRLLQLDLAHTFRIQC